MLIFLDAAMRRKNLRFFQARIQFDEWVEATILSVLGKDKNASNEKARRLLGWMPRSPSDAILATAVSLSELGLLKAA